LGHDITGIEAMRSGLLAITMVALVAAPGCTHRVLMRSMVHQASTVMDIEYQMVLDNIAMFECNPSALPWHVRINNGVVQVNDQEGIEGLGVQWGATANFTRGPSALRSVSEQWGADAVTNPRIVKKLQDVYREVIGVPPEPDPEFFKYVKQVQPKPKKSTKPEADGDNWTEEIPPPEGIASDETPSPGSWPDFEVPTGWFRVGCKSDVPRNACYVGHHGDCYVWVTSHGESGLSRFTLTVLAITGTGARSIAEQGLTFTR
jgi:hypothetical protein